MARQKYYEIIKLHLDVVFSSNKTRMNISYVGCFYTRYKYLVLVYCAVLYLNF